MPPLTPVELEDLIAEDLSRRSAIHQLRRRRVFEPVSPTQLRFEGEVYVNFASNDYLGLTHHPRVIEAATQAARRHGAGSGAAALITGYTQAHASCEKALGQWKGTAAAVMLPSGYQANVAAVQTLAALGKLKGGGGGGGGTRFLLDKLAHASLIDAVRGLGSLFRVWAHNDVADLEHLLASPGDARLDVVVTESIFSMDGDAADLRGIAELKRRFPFVLLLDEAHGSGVYGAGGAGYAAEQQLADAVDVTVVTLSKALGCAGGAVCASAGFCDALLNHGRAYIFSTSVSPMVAAAVEEAIAVLRDEPQRQARVRELAGRVRREMQSRGLAIQAGDSPIVPVILGSEEAALSASQRLMEAGMIVPAVRPPTVPRDSSRLRVTLCCEHADEEIAGLIEACARVKAEG